MGPYSRAHAKVSCNGTCDIYLAVILAVCMLGCITGKRIHSLGIEKKNNGAFLTLVSQPYAID